MANKTFDNAKAKKQDEFYTQLTDIEKELKNYQKHFKGKTILCNCDDPRVSNFFKYFALNFNKFGIKKIITTCFKSQNINSFSTNECAKAVYLEYNGSETDHIPDDNELQIKELNGSGDFRSDECIELLKQSDIVITNPPFSLFREYIAQLIKYKKKFIIIGNQNALTYKEIFSLIKDNKIWLGYKNGDMAFRVPDYYKPKKTRFWIDENGNKWRSMGNICWFTNLDIKKRHENLELVKKYNPEDYQFFENYNAINVDKYADIPKDYYDVMGVPITFLCYYSPYQFEIVGLGIVGSCEFTNNRKMEILDKQGRPTNKFTMNAKGTLYRKHLDTDKKPASFKDVENGILYQSIFARVLIKRIKKDGE